MRKKFIYLLIITTILVFVATGCRLDISLREIIRKEAVPEEPGLEETLDVSEKPDIELFDKYFTQIQLGVCTLFLNHGKQYIQFSKCTLLPHQETQFSFIIKEDAWSKFEAKYKKNFTFICRVFNLETNKFVKRGTLALSPEYGETNIIILEALEWAFLRPGNYEYRVYVEDKLVAAIPFEIISYADYFKKKLGLN
ncbi:MAG: hypothetical protein H5T85_06975 [Actinobacteria bacterium]|nr:hypothetical protein [Actinomycetota bacterium]